MHSFHQVELELQVSLTLLSCSVWLPLRTHGSCGVSTLRIFCISIIILSAFVLRHPIWFMFGWGLHTNQPGSRSPLSSLTAAAAAERSAELRRIAVFLKNGKRHRRPSPHVACTFSVSFWNFNWKVPTMTFLFLCITIQELIADHRVKQSIASLSSIYESRLPE